MPVFQSGLGNPPDWCELEHFDVVELAPGETHDYERVAAKEKLVVTRGRCGVSYGGQKVVAEEGANLDITDRDSRFAVDDIFEPTVLVRMCGHWGDDLGGSGLFACQSDENPIERGDPTPYTKTTSFDNHWHDCDEYWLVFEGRADVVSEGVHYTIGPGDCLATGMGHHHDVQHVIEPLRAVYFETTVQRKKRRGHLWEHEHGPAKPDPARV